MLGAGMLITRTLHQATAALVVVLVTAPATEAQTPLSLQRLAEASTAVVIGRVESMASGRDPATQGIYTYVSVAVSELLEGANTGSPIVVKQLGGRLDDEGALVPGQARFAVGEEVLLFLAVRPRDRSLYTAGLWQGKWSIEPDAITGESLAVRRDGDGSAIDARALSSLRAELGGRLPAVIAGELNVAPFEAPREAMPFVLRDPPLRWMAPGVVVRMDAGGQPGLSGGGGAEIAAAMAQWNGAGSSLTLNGGGASSSPPCAPGFGAIQIKFNDPCGEIGDPLVLAVSVLGYTTSGSQTIGGRVFFPITDADIITSANPARRSTLILPPCFQSTIAHELGHAIGFLHSPDPTALMYFDVTGCAQGARPLAADDIAALFATYPSPGGGAGTPGSATVTSASAAAGLLNIAWTLGAGAPPTGHRLEFFSGATQVASLTVGLATTAAIPIPPGTTGSFSVRVTALNGSTPGGSSPLFPFTIGTGGGGGGGSCTSPPASPAVMGTIVLGTASVSWPAVPGATSYIISAGTTQGAANLFPATNLGTQTFAGANGLPSGFAAWVRVVAVNACGQSAPMDLYLQFF